MIIRIDIPVIAGDEDFSLSAGDTAKIIAGEATLNLCIREVVDVTWFSSSVAIFDVIAEVKPCSDDSDAK